MFKILRNFPAAVNRWACLYLADLITRTKYTTRRSRIVDRLVMKAESYE